MSALQIVFLVTALVTLASGVMVVTVRKMMHAALWLILTLLGVAVLFAILEASFFVAVQVIIYIGAITILIIFTIMLTRRVMEDTGPQTNRLWWIPALVSGGLLVALVFAFITWDRGYVDLDFLPGSAVGIAELGKAFVSPDQFLIPFEVASILLLAALIGAIYIANEHKK
ncbi:MAG TPA: NADH-quinone oxidoreductase subunit J [Anaerolineaceae bacterium]